MKKVPTLVIVLRADEEEDEGYWDFCYFEWDFQPEAEDLRHFYLQLPKYKWFSPRYNRALKAW